MLKCCSINTLATVRTSLFGIGYSQQYLLNNNMYSFSPTYPVKGGTRSLVLTGILRSLVKQVSHPPFKNLSFCLADSMKNPLRNLFNIPSNPLCPHRSLWWQRLHTSLIIDYGRHIRHTSPTQFLLAALLNINTPSFILNTAGSNMKHATKTSHALPLVFAFSGNCPFSTQLITLLQTLSLDCSLAILIRLCCICWISFTPPSNLITGSSIS